MINKQWVILADWHEKEDEDGSDRLFGAEVDLTDDDLTIKVFDKSGDKFPLTTVNIENDGGRLVLRIWGNEYQDPIRTFELPIDRDGRGYDLATGEEVENG